MAGTAAVLEIALQPLPRFPIQVKAMHEKHSHPLVPIHLIDAGEYPWSRRAFFSEVEIEALASQILQTGDLLEPVVVRQKEDGRFELLGSRLPLLAAERVGLRMVPIRLARSDDHHTAMEPYAGLFAKVPPLVQGWVLLEVKRILDDAGQPSGPRPLARAVGRASSAGTLGEYARYAAAIPWEALEAKLARFWAEGRKEEVDINAVKRLSVDALHDIAQGLIFDEDQESGSANEDERDRRLEIAMEALARGDKPEVQLRADARVQTQPPRRRPGGATQSDRSRSAPVPAPVARPSATWNPSVGPRLVHGAGRQLRWEHRGWIGKRRVRWFSEDRAGRRLIECTGIVFHEKREYRVARIGSLPSKVSVRQRWTRWLTTCQDLLDRGVRALRQLLK